MQQVFDEESSIKTVTQESELAPNRVAIRRVYDVPTRGIAKLLITAQAGTKEERTFVGRLGLIAARYGLSVATLTQSYLQWRDANLLVLGPWSRSQPPSYAARHRR